MCQVLSRFTTAILYLFRVSPRLLNDLFKFLLCAYPAESKLCTHSGLISPRVSTNENGQSMQPPSVELCTSFHMALTRSTDRKLKATSS